MPGPDPHGLWINRDASGTITAQYVEYGLWGDGNSANRLKRARRIIARMTLRTWVCRWCMTDLCDSKRADARYCGESCRKKAARKRRVAKPC